MTFIVSAIVLAISLVILSRMKVLMLAAKAPVAMLVLGAAISLIYRSLEGPSAPSLWVAAGADALLGALAFVAAAQFRITRLARACPASFRLTLGGAPLFLLICGLGAFLLEPNLSLGAAFLIAGVLALNGAAFDRRAVADAPAPSVIKGAVRLESAAVLALGLPIALMLEAIETAAPAGAPLATPYYEFAVSACISFAIGGSLGLLSALIGNHREF